MSPEDCNMPIYMYTTSSFIIPTMYEKIQPSHPPIENFLHLFGACMAECRLRDSPDIT